MISKTTWVLFTLTILGGLLYHFTTPQANQWEQGIFDRLPFENRPLDQVQQVIIQDAEHKTVLNKQGEGWTVAQRGNYPANNQMVNDFILSLVETRIISEPQIGPSLYNHLQLSPADPMDPMPGTQLILNTAAGESLLKIHAGKPFYTAGQVQDDAVSLQGGKQANGRYVLLDDDPKAKLIAQPLSQLTANPQAWLDTQLFGLRYISTVEAVNKWVLNKTAENSMALAGMDAETQQINNQLLSKIFGALYDFQLTNLSNKPELRLAALQAPETLHIYLEPGLQVTIQIGMREEDTFYVGAEISQHERLRSSFLRKLNAARKVAEIAGPSATEAEKVELAALERSETYAQNLLKRAPRLKDRTFIIPAVLIEPLLSERENLILAK